MPKKSPPPIDEARRRLLKTSMLAGVAGAATPFTFRAEASTQPRRAAAAEPTFAVRQAEIAPLAPGELSADVAAASRGVGSDFMVDVLRQARIKYVAAMPGSSFRGLHESILNYAGNSEPELISCVHEEISAAFCHGYAKVAGAPMACLVHSNVGLQHAAMAVYNAWCDRVPMMVIGGNHADATERRPGPEWVHSAQDLGALVRDFVKWEDQPRSLQHFAESFMRAHQLSTTPPFEPVFLAVDGKLQEQELPSPQELTIPRYTSVSGPGGDDGAVRQALRMLQEAQSPVIVVDRLARNQEGVDGLVRFAEWAGAPVIDLGGRMNMPTNHFLNQTWMQRSLIAQADVVLALEVGDLWGVLNSVSDLPHRESRRQGRADAKIIAASANYAFLKSNNQDFQRYQAAELTVAADGQTFLSQLISAIGSAPGPGVTPERRKRNDDRYANMRKQAKESAAKAWNASPISTARLCMELWGKISHLDWALVSDTWTVSYWPQRLWDFTQHHQFIGGAGGYGIGYGAPAAAGAALCHRDQGRIPVSIQADGDLMVLPGTLWTLAHHKIPLLSVMHNNRAWHQETMHLQRMTSWRDRGAKRWNIGTRINEPNIDFAMMARSMGVWAEGPITQPEDLGPALDRALEVVRGGRPALLDVVTQPR